MSRYVPVVLLVLVVFGLCIGGTVAADDDDDEIEVVIPDDTVVAGEETTLAIQVTNRATGVGETMQGTIVRLEAKDAPLSVRTAGDSLGNVPTGASLTSTFDVIVDEDAEPGTYELEVTVSYREAEELEDGTLDPTVTTVEETIDIEVTVEERARFAVVEAKTDTHVGEPGTVELALKNVGTDAAENATVELQSVDPGLQVGGGTTFSRSFGGEWAVNETKTVRVAARASETTEARTHSIETTVRFYDDFGVRRTDDVREAGVEIGPKQAFSVTNVTSTLRVGKDGRVNATIVNEGERPAENVVAILESPNPNIATRDPEAFVGTLEPGEEGHVSFRVGLREDAEPGERVLPLVARYRTPHGDDVFSDPIDVVALVDEEIDPFAIEAIDRTIRQGEEITYEVEVENTGGERYTDIEAQLFVNPPLSTTDDEAYIPALDPGETATIAFGLEAEGDATPKTYPVSVDFRYEDEVGDRHLTDRMRLSVEVLERELSPLAIVGVVVALLAILAGIGYWQRERIREAIGDVGDR